MCGRFTLRAPASAIAQYFALLEIPSFMPRFNIAPTQPVAVVRQVATSAGVRRQWVPMRWGLIPSWAKDPAIGHRMINARAETASRKPAYRAAFRRRRCLIPADGFYEWQGTRPPKQPYFIRLRDDRPFGIAGLWETWEGPDHQTVESCTILTTEANELMRPIHDRMPVILAEREYDVWLDPATEGGPALDKLLVPCDSRGMVAHPVGAWVNNPAHDDPRCIEPEVPRRQRGLFD